MIKRNLDSDFLYDHLPSGFISYLPNGEIIRANKTLSKWLGIDNKELCQLNFKSIINKASALYYNMVIDPLLNLEGIANEISLTFKSTDGEIDALFNAVSDKDELGGIILIHATVQKISYRKKYEKELLLEKRYAEEERKRFEFLSNKIPNQIWSVAADGRCTYVNNKVKDYFGDQPMDFYTEFNGIAMVDRESCRQLWKICLATGKIFEKEIRFTSLSKKEEWFFVSIEPHYNQQGLIESWFGSSTNIHKQKTLQISNYSSLKLNLSNAHKTLDENRQLFVNIAINQSHVVRKPLANILGLLHVLEDEELPKESQKLFNMLQISIQELDEMIKIASNPLNTPIK